MLLRLPDMRGPTNAIHHINLLTLHRYSLTILGWFSSSGQIFKISCSERTGSGLHLCMRSRSPHGRSMAGRCPAPPRRPGCTRRHPAAAKAPVPPRASVVEASGLADHHVGASRQMVSRLTAAIPQLLVAPYGGGASCFEDCFRGRDGLECDYRPRQCRGAKDAHHFELLLRSVLPDHRVTVALAATRRADTMLRRWVGAAVNVTRRAATGRAAVRVESMEVAIATSL